MISCLLWHMHDHLLTFYKANPLCRYDNVHTLDHAKILMMYCFFFFAMLVLICTSIFYINICYWLFLGYFIDFIHCLHLILIIQSGGKQATDLEEKPRHLSPQRHSTGSPAPPGGLWGVPKPDTQSLQWVLGLCRGLFLVGHVWSTSKRRYPPQTTPLLIALF